MSSSSTSENVTELLSESIVLLENKILGKDSAIAYLRAENEYYKSIFNKLKVDTMDQEDQKKIVHKMFLVTKHQLEKMELTDGDVEESLEYSWTAYKVLKLQMEELERRNKDLEEKFDWTIKSASRDVLEKTMTEIALINSEKNNFKLEEKIVELERKVNELKMEIGTKKVDCGKRPSKFVRQRSHSFSN